MKMDMMVTGLNAVEEEIMEIEFVPIIQVQKKVSIMKLAGGNLQDIQKAMQGQKQYRSKIYVSRSFASDNRIMPFDHLIIDVDVVKKEG